MTSHQRNPDNNIKNNPDYNWNMHCISENKNITWEIVSNNKQYNWVIPLLIENKNMSLEIIKKHFLRCCNTGATN